jgi:hypothetical protein
MYGEGDRTCRVAMQGYEMLQVSHRKPSRVGRPGKFEKGCPGTSGGGCRGLVCHVSCVVVPGAGCSGLLSWVGVLCDVVARVGQCKHGGGAQMTHLAGLPLVGSPLLSVAPQLCPTCLTSLE